MIERVWKITLAILLAGTGSLLLWGGLVSKPAAVSAARPIDWPEIQLVEVTSGLDYPVHITHAGDGSGRLFAVEQGGMVRIIKGGTLQSTPFLDITDRVKFGGGNSEEGLLSVAFPPDYASKNYFYVYYTSKIGANNGDNIVARFFVVDLVNNPDEADPNSEQLVLTINHPGQTNHNGGQLAFGPNDGYLYIGTGDGGGGGDPDDNAQDFQSLLGKMLRIDVETGSPMTYTIPTSNPFTQTAALDEIWALGLRNPWRFSFDRQTGDLYIGDVGQVTREEVDFQPTSSSGGENYGWNILEGFLCYPPPSTGCTPPLNYSPPITDYDRSLGFTVTGGFVYRGPYYPRMQGMYFYADHGTGRIWGLKHDGMAWQGQELLGTSHNISTFGEDEAGNLYLAHRASGTNGTIYQVIDNVPPDLTQSDKTVSPMFGGVGDSFTFTVNLINNGPPLTQTTYVTDTLPTGLNYVSGTLNAAFGTVSNSGNTLFWQGLMNPTSTLQITYQVTATGEAIGTVSNLVQIKPEGTTSFNRTASVVILSEEIYLPAIFK